MRRLTAAGLVLLVLCAAACAPALVVPPPAAGLRYPDFIYPAPPDRVGDQRTRGRHEAAWSRLQAGDLRGAASAFAALGGQQPAFFPAIAALGYTLVAEGKPNDALARFEAVLRRAPQYAPALAGRAEALLAAGQRDAAIAGFEAALAADGSLADLRRRIDVLKFDRVQQRIAEARRSADAGRLDDARDAYTAALAASPESGFLYRELGLVELRRKDLGAAERALQKAAELDPADARALVGLADVLDGRGDIGGALAALDKAYALDPSPALKQRLERLRERSQSSALPEQYAAIPGLPQITRGDLAALIGVRLRPVIAASRTRSSVVATDVRGHWAARWIVEIIRAGVMDVFPNHTFQPKTLIRRADLAQAVSRLLTMTGAGAGRNRVTLGDVGPDHVSYADISAAVASGVLSVEGNAFRPSRPVSGQEAVDSIQRLQRLVAAAQGGSR